MPKWGGTDVINCLRILLITASFCLRRHIVNGDRIRWQQKRTAIGDRSLANGVNQEFWSSRSKKILAEVFRVKIRT